VSYYQINKLTFLHRPCVFVQLYCLTSFLILVFLSCGSVAHFLESRGMLEEALEIATDADYKFDLAVQLGKLDVAKVLNILSLMFFF